MKRSPSPGSASGGYKRSRGGEDEFETTFEDELIAMEANEAALVDQELIDSEIVSDSMTGVVSQRWSRPKAMRLDPSVASLALQWYDIDMTSGEPLLVNPSGGDRLGSVEGPVPIVRLFGVSQAGESVMVSVHGFTPYFMASVPTNFALTDASLSALRVVFDQKVMISLYLNTFICSFL